MFISPAWISANSAVLSESAPSGDGEHDYALLAITGSASGSTSLTTGGAALPTIFPAIPLASVAPTTNEPVVIASYGAQFLQSAQIQSSLYPTIVYGSVKGVYTFDTETPDIIALGGSAAAQEGSSGGGVAGTSGISKPRLPRAPSRVRRIRAM